MQSGINTAHRVTKVLCKSPALVAAAEILNLKSKLNTMCFTQI